MVLSTALFEKPAFRNLICNGLILAEDGKKMAKRLKNYPSPMEVIGDYGADALRLYLINSPVVRAEPLRFKKDGVYGVVKDVFLPWYNAYRFLVQNAKRLEIEGFGLFTPVDQLTLQGSLNVLDQWINSSTESLVHFVRQEMEAYRLYTVVPYLLKFIDNLTNIYVKVRDGGTDWGWGVVVNVVKKPGTALASGVTPSRGTNYIVDTLLHCSPGLNENGSRAKPCPPRPGEKGEMHVVPVPLPLISGISSIRIVVPSDLRPAEARQTVLLAVQELGKRYPLSIQFFHLPLGISHGGSVFFSGDKSSCRHYQHGWFTKALHQTQLAEKIGQ